MTKPATHPTQVFVNGRAFAWTPETGLDPAAVSALDDYLWREANRTARAFRRLGVEADDLYQEAYLHCLGAARRYDPTRGANFLTFASYAVRAAMAAGTRTLVRGSAERPRLEVCSYDAPLPNGDGDTAWIDTLAGEAPCALGLAEDRELQERLQGLLGRLNGRDREVLSLRLGLGLAEGLDLPTIASRLGLTRTQVEGSLRRAADQAQGGMPLAS